MADRVILCLHNIVSHSDLLTHDTTVHHYHRLYKNIVMIDVVRYNTTRLLLVGGVRDPAAAKKEGDGRPPLRQAAR